MRIIGTGSAHPSCVVTNDMLSGFLDTNDEWIKERTGIRERRVISDENLEDLAVLAAERAIENAGLTPADIDYVICSNTLFDYVTPSIACMIQGKLGTRCPGIDMNGACTGFIYAIDSANALLATGRARNILIVCAEEPDRMADWQDRSICVLFGAGVGAAVLTTGDSLKSIKLSTQSNSDVLYYRRPLEPTPYLKKEEVNTTLKMKGKEVFRMAVSSSVRDLRSVLKEAGLAPADIKYYVLHQANLRILEAIRQMLKVEEEKFPSNVHLYGNTSSASVPMLLDELNRAGKLQKGDIIALGAFGAGFTSGACVVEWG